MARVGDQRHKRADIAGGPGAGHQLLARGRRVGGAADQLDDIVDIGDRDGQAYQYVTTIARLGEIKFGAAGDDFLAEIHKGSQQLLQIHLNWAAVIQRQHIDAEALLQVRETIELVEHHFAGSVALELDHQPHAGTIAFVANVRNTLDALVAH